MRWLSLLLGTVFLMCSCNGEPSNGTPCGDCDDGVACTVDTCNEQTETCKNDPDDSACPNGEFCDLQLGCVECVGDANCDDFQWCNGDETCVDNKCQAGTQRDCHDTVDCTDDTCDESMNVCINTPNDANCPQDFRCDATEGCKSLICDTDIDCRDLTNICKAFTCVNHLCQYENNPVSCNDGFWCTENDECVDMACQGTLRDCGTASGPCKRMACDESSESCVEEDILPGEPCDDELWCTENDACTQAALCVGTPRDCSAATTQCANGVCDDDADACVGESKNEGQSCNDNDPCTEGDICWDGNCYADPKDCDDDNPCTDDSCDPQNGNCINTPRADCKPTGDPCDQNDQCMGGLCLFLIDGFEGGYCSQNCEGGVTCVGTGNACVDYAGDMLCFKTCPLGQGDTCPDRAGYRCAPVGLGSQGVCWPGEDVCDNSVDDDHDGPIDCNDEDCATAPNCIVECTAGSGTVACNSQKTDDTSPDPDVYDSYIACTSHRYTGPEHIYSLTPQVPGNLIATLDTGGAFDGALLVLSENCWPELSCTAHDERSGATFESVQVPMTAGETYYIVVEGYGPSDSGSYTLTVACGEPEDCDDNVDNDEDGTTDCYDADCAGDPACLAAEVACADNLDNDDDGDTDCDDWDCRNDPACLPESNCRDKVDNDADGFTDCQDDDCLGDSWCDAEQICDDQYDNDNDMGTDCWDEDCASDPYCQAETDCRDDIDNDADGDADCEDDDCANDDWCKPESNCTDTIDNDNDGDTDCDDEDCQGDPDCVERCTADETFTQCDQSRNDTTTGLPNNLTLHDCDDSVSYDGPEYVYAFTPSSSGEIFFQLTAAGWDSALFIMEDECTPSLPCYDNADAPPGSPEQITVNAVAGTTYYAIIDSVSESGSFNFQMICVTPTEQICDDGMDNDRDELPDCADDDCEFDPACTTTCTPHETVGCGDNEFDDTSSTNTITTYNCAFGEYFPGGERIYRFSPSSDTDVTFTILGSIGDFAMFAMEGACMPSNTCTEWVDEDGGIGVDLEMVDFHATAGTDYYVVVDSASGSFQLGYWLTVDCQ